MQGSANLNLMIRAARRAGRSLAKDFREVENLQVSVKGAGDFVTRADITAEKIIEEELRGGRPNYGWLGEEGGAAKGADPTRRWIVDPLDGTTNFLHGLPHWSVSIALERKGSIVAGVVYDPTRDEMFIAEQGQGAWMNQSRLRVSGRRQMEQALFATGLPFAAFPELREKMRDVGRVSPGCSGVRSTGSSALDLAYVAAGRFDGAWERRLKPWDMAAGILLVKEAGGFVEALSPDGKPLQSGQFIAANDRIFERFSKLLREE